MPPQSFICITSKDSMQNPKATMRKTFSVIGIITFSTVVVCIIGWLLTQIVANSLFQSNHPEDQQLIDKYAQYKTEFNQLAQMLLQETRPLAIFPDSGNCQIEDEKLVNSATNEKCKAYIQLFRLLGLNWAYSGPEPLWLTVSSYGLGVSGSEKGYVYTSQLPTLDGAGTLVNNIEEASGFLLPYFRHVDDNWYIYYDET